MTDTTYHLPESQLDDGTIDFYALLGESPAADEETLRSKIQAIYSYATANRDHRNLNKRREFQALLELLPAARTALLEPPKRARYDEYLDAVKSGNADTDFETFMNDLLGTAASDEDKTSLLGIQEKKEEPRARVIKTPAPAPVAPTATAPAKAATPRVAPAPPVAASGGGAQRSPTGFFGAIAGFVAGFVIGMLFFHGSILIGLGIGLVLGAIGFFALNKTPGGRVGT